MSVVPAPAQTLKVVDSDNNKINLVGAVDGSLTVADQLLRDYLAAILNELRLIRTHLEVITDQRILSEDVEEV